MRHEGDMWKTFIHSHFVEHVLEMNNGSAQETNKLQKPLVSSEYIELADTIIARHCCIN